MEVLIMEANREGYSIDQIRETWTVGQLIGWLEQFDDDTPIYTSQDNGYTYGGITIGNFREDEISEEE